MASFTKSNVTDDEWEKTEQALASIQMVSELSPCWIKSLLPNVLRLSQEESVETKPVKKFNPTEEIDSAFINAMNNPRERMMLFQFEDYMVKFVKSNEKGFEAPSWGFLLEHWSLLRQARKVGYIADSFMMN